MSPSIVRRASLMAAALLALARWLSGGALASNVGMAALCARGAQ